MAILSFVIHITGQLGLKFEMVLVVVMLAHMMMVPVVEVLNIALYLVLSMICC
jgi:hypothetical protein